MQWAAEAQAETMPKFGPGEAVLDGDLPGHDVGDHLRDAERGEARRARGR